MAFTLLPKALKENSITELMRFESSYEKVGIPALIIQVVSGMWLAYHLMPNIGMWFDSSNPISRLILIKLGLLLTTVLFALDARIRVIPNMDETKLKSLAFHIIPVTFLSVLFVIIGVSFRTGKIF